jgi:hypothetical protein
VQDLLHKVVVKDNLQYLDSYHQEQATRTLSHKFHHSYRDSNKQTKDSTQVLEVVVLDLINRKKHKHTFKTNNIKEDEKPI